MNNIPSTSNAPPVPLGEVTLEQALETFNDPATARRKYTLVVTPSQISDGVPTFSIKERGFLNALKVCCRIVWAWICRKPFHESYTAVEKALIEGAVSSFEQTHNNKPFPKAFEYLDYTKPTFCSYTASSLALINNESVISNSDDSSSEGDADSILEVSIPAVTAKPPMNIDEANRYFDRQIEPLFEQAKTQLEMNIRRLGTKKEIAELESTMAQFIYELFQMKEEIMNKIQFQGRDAREEIRSDLREFVLARCKKEERVSTPVQNEVMPPRAWKTPLEAFHTELDSLFKEAEERLENYGATDYREALEGMKAKRIARFEKDGYANGNSFSHVKKELEAFIASACVIDKTDLLYLNGRLDKLKERVSELTDHNEIFQQACRNLQSRVIACLEKEGVRAAKELFHRGDVVILQEAREFRTKQKERKEREEVKKEGVKTKIADNFAKISEDFARLAALKSSLEAKKIALSNQFKTPGVMQSIMAAIHHEAKVKHQEELKKVEEELKSVEAELEEIGHKKSELEKLLNSDLPAAFIMKQFENNT